MSSPLFSLCGALFTIINSFITILHINDILISIFLQPPDLVTTLFDQGSVLLRLLFSLLHLNYHHHQWQQCRNLMSLACHLSSSSFVPFSLLFLLTTVIVHNCTIFLCSLDVRNIVQGGDPLYAGFFSTQGSGGYT